MKVQDILLNEARKKKISLTIYLMNGVPVKGTIQAFDSFIILVESEDKKQSLIYKHAISTIIPAKSLSDYRKAIEEKQQDSDNG